MRSLKHVMLKTTAILALVVSLAGCKEDSDNPPVDTCAAKAGNNASHPKAAVYQAILDQYVQKGFPGLVLYVKTPKDGAWTGAAGKASIETGELMQPCNLIYSQSIGKTFTAVSVMKLVDADKIDLDNPIRTYLPAAICDRIANANQATVQQLLNNTSGIRSYTFEPEYDSALRNRAQGMTTQKNLESVYDKPALFAPGTDFDYSNTNYLLLGMIIDRVTGASHADFFTQRIFRPLGLTDMYYKNELRNNTPAGVHDTYGDVAGTGELENVTDIETRVLSTYYGEAGLLGLASNYAKFVEAIFKGDLVSPASRTAMTSSWVKMENSLSIDVYYGLGLMKRSTPYGYGIGHAGDGIGTASDMFYFPDSDITIVMETNKSLGMSLEDARLYREELWNEVVRVALDR